MEIEFDKKIFEMNKKEMVEMLKNFWKEISEITNKAKERIETGETIKERKENENEKELEKNFTKNFAKMEQNSKKVKKMKKKILYYLGYQNINENKMKMFPGSYPIYLNRERKKEMDDNYFFSEKNFGERYFIFIPRKNKNCYFYFVDSNFQFYTLKTNTKMVEFFSFHGDTLIDGEIVRNNLSSQFFFLSFDILVSNGNILHSEPFFKRLFFLTNLIYNFQLNFQQKIFFLQMEVKKFFKFDEFHNFLSKIKNDHFHFSENINYFTNGIVFVPNNTPYLPYANHFMFKWKKENFATLDFQISLREKPKKEGATFFLLFLSAISGEKIVSCKKANFSIEKRLSLINLFKNYSRSLNQNLIDLLLLENNNNINKIIKNKEKISIISRCFFNKQTNEWNFVEILENKILPDHIEVVFDTLEYISQEITLEEIDLFVNNLIQKKLN